jgi:hypothetical protein
MVRIMLSLCALAACVDTDLDGPPYRVEVLTLAGVDATTGTGRYALAPVELPELQSLSPMRDPAFRFVAKPAIDLGKLSELPEVEQARRPPRAPDYVPRLRDVDGVGVPRDMTSLQVLSAYHAFREVIAVLPELTGGDASAIVPQRGFEVWVQPRLELGPVSLEMTANAFYASPLDAFGLVGIDPIEKLPVGAVPPVLAHEFGHHLFYRSFGHADGACDRDDTDPRAPGRFSHEAAIAGFNEGYADLVSFAVTGVTNPIADVLPLDSAGERTIDVRLPGATVFRYGGAECGGEYYCVGTLFARSLVEAALLRGEDVADRAVRMSLAREAFRIASEVPALLRQRSWPATKPCEGSGQIDSAIVSAFLGAFVTQVPVAWRASVCARFADNFGDTGFGANDRSMCP